MTLHQLRIFECVARQLNMTKASMALHLSQPSVSQQLRLLEEEFGKKLFVRLNQGMELTPEGKEFFKAILPFLVQAEDLEKRFKANGRMRDGGLLSVGRSRNVSAEILPKLLIWCAAVVGRHEIGPRLEAQSFFPHVFFPRCGNEFRCCLVRLFAIAE